MPATVDRRAFFCGATALACAALAGGATPASAQSLADLVDSVNASGNATANAIADGLFGTKEFTNSSLKALPQWARVLEHVPAKSPAFASCRKDPDNCTNAAARAWQELQRSAVPLGRMAKLHAVNRFFNRWPYKTDREGYGRREVWASPEEFMVRSGDCEDFAIAKFFALRQLGFGNAELRIVVIYDQIRAIGHAVLAVYDAKDILILDSLSNFIGSHTRYRHYIPQYSMNETTRWAHVDNKRAIPQTAFRTTNP